MARAIWSGSISFGLVTIPVQLFPATRTRDISFHLLHRDCQTRIRYLKYCPYHDRQVDDNEIVKAYEYQRGRYVVITDEELESAAPELSRSIDILDFVDERELDPIYYEKAYYLAPKPGSAKAYILLGETLRRSARVAVAQCVIRTKQYLTTIRPKGVYLMMETMYYPDEVVQPVEIPQLEVAAEVTDKELDLAESLVGTLASGFDPSKYRDAYRERVMDMVRKKVAGEEIVITKPVEKPPVVDLMTALKTSLEQARAQRAA